MDGGAGDAGDVDGGDGGTVSGLQVATVTPSSGPVDGRCNPLCRITIGGSGFTTPARGLRVFFGEYEVNTTTTVFNNQGLINVFLPTASGPGVVDVKVRIVGGDDGVLEEAVLPNGFTYFNALSINTVTPNVVPATGGTPVTLQGAGFEDGQVVTFGGRAGTQVSIADGGFSLTTVTPPGNAGRADVEVISRFGTAKLPLGLRYVEQPVLELVEPAVGALGGGNVVTLRGTGFTEDVRVSFGGVTARLVDFAGVQEARVVVPAGMANRSVDVEVTEPALGLSSTLRNAYTYVADLTVPALTTVAPSRGTTAGGQTVHLLGRFLDGTNLSVMFGATPASDVTVVDAHHLTAVTPFAPAGVVDVSVTRDGTTLTLAQAYTYETVVRVTGVTPSGGPAAGGTNLTITGASFAANCTFQLGGIALVATVVDPVTVTAAAPAGSPGVVDLTVQCPGAGSATFKDAFTYAGALSVMSVEPIRGAIAGGTFVTVRGTGFSSRTGLQVNFGDTSGSAVDVRSDSLLHVRAPAHGPGLVDVTVRAGAESATRDRAFTFYDPSFIVGGARGGAINGAVNIAAYDLVTGFPVFEALAVLGTESGAQYTAFTDERGHATLSGPDVYGAQTVTIAHCNYQYVTFGGINAADITVFMIPSFPPRCGTPSPPQPPPPGPPLPPPPIIRGKVTGFAKELFDPANLGANEIAAAFVYHTWPSPFSGPPGQWEPAPSQTVFVEGGRYEIPFAWRTGPMAIIAIAGIYNTETAEFRVTQLGFNRGLTADLGGVYEDRDIVLSIPLTKRLTVQFPDAPYMAPNTTDNIFIAYVNLGGEGAHPVPGWDKQGINSERQYVLENFAQAPGDLFTFIARFMSNTPSTLPYSTVLQDGEGPLGDAIALGPLMGFPALLDPVDNGAMNQRTIRVRTPTGQQPSFYEFTFNAQDGTSWSAYLEGNRNKLILPTFPTYATEENAPFNLPPGGISGGLEAVFVPNFDYNNWSYLELWGAARRSWSNINFRFVNGGN